MGQRYRSGKSEAGPVCVAHNHDFTKGGELQSKVMKFSQISKLEDVVS